MTESILTSIKKLLHVGDDDTDFDVDIMMHINTAFATLQQLGVGPALGFEIQDATTEWSAYTIDDLGLNPVKTYVYIRVRLLFDPPESSHAREAFSNQAKELEWRLNVHADKFPVDVATVGVIDGGLVE